MLLFRCHQNMLMIPTPSITISTRKWYVRICLFCASSGNLFWAWTPGIVSANRTATEHKKKNVMWCAFYSHSSIAEHDKSFNCQYQLPSNTFWDKGWSPFALCCDSCFFLHWSHWSLPQNLHMVLWTNVKWVHSKSSVICQVIL